MGCQRHSLGVSSARWCAVLILTLALTFSLAMPAAAFAPSAAVEPRTIALTTDDLPAGFVVDAEYTREAFLEGVGPSYQIQFHRQPAFGQATDAPLIVAQLIVRVDTAASPGAVLAALRQSLIEREGFAESAAGNDADDGFALQKTEGGFEHHAVGIVKAPVVIVTVVGSAPGRATNPVPLQLAGISAGRLD